MIANFAVAAVFCQDYGSSTTECVSEDWLDEVREVDLADLKQEPDDVCCVLYPIYQFTTAEKNVPMIANRSSFQNFVSYFLIE